MLRIKNRPWLLAAIGTMAAVGAMVVLLVAGAGSATTYGILFPDVWAAQLSFVNSTDQFEAVTEYRNATDDRYDNVTQLIEGFAVGPGNGSTADPQYMCVEYAVRLHDEAERRGLNCTVVRTGTGRETPGHALVAFCTTDRGMLLVDPTATNVSAEDYPGVDFSKVLLLREQWKVTLPLRDVAGINPVVTERRDAVPVPFTELVAFLAGDDTEEQPYVIPNYTCLDFAATLHDRAEATGIQCGVVTVAFEDRAQGHAFDAFPTSDRGVVYVDCTGINRTDPAGAVAATDNVVYLLNGSEFGELPLAAADGSLDYGYYLDQKGRIDAYREQWEQYAADVSKYNAEVAGHDARLAGNDQAYAAYRDECDRYAAALAEYNRQMDLHNSGVMDYNEGDTGVAIPAAPDNAAELEAWRARLDKRYAEYQATWNQLKIWRLQLIDQKAALDSRMTALSNAEVSKLITYSPMGTVNDIEIYWG